MDINKKQLKRFRRQKKSFLSKKKLSSLGEVYNERNQELASIGMSYKDYLASDHWKHTAKMHKNRRINSFCFCCHSSDNLELHHTSYREMLTMKGTNLITVCRECHQDIHDFSTKEDCDLKYATYMIYKKCNDARKYEYKRQKRISKRLNYE